jgi:hypothetical protein
MQLAENALKVGKIMKDAVDVTKQRPIHTHLACSPKLCLLQKRIALQALENKSNGLSSLVIIGHL